MILLNLIAEILKKFSYNPLKMNRLAVVILLVCLSAVLIPNEVDAFFKAGRGLSQREVARQSNNGLEGEYGAADARELWEALMKAKNSERKRGVQNRA